MKISPFLSVLVLALGMGACQSKRSKESSESPPEPGANLNAPPRQVGPPPLDPAKVTWTRRTFEKAKLSFDAIDGVGAQDSMMGLASYVRQHRDPVTITIWAGPGRTVERWRNGLKNRKGVVLGEPKKLRVCDAEAEMQEVDLPARRLRVGGRQLQRPANALELHEAGKARDGGSADRAGAAPADKAAIPKAAPSSNVGFRTRPARKGIVLGFKNGDTPVIASWSIVAEHREAFRKLEEHFFASIKCDPPTSK